MFAYFCFVGVRDLEVKVIGRFVCRRVVFSLRLDAFICSIDFLLGLK